MSVLDIQKEKVRFLTLGCRVNQYETQAMREDLLHSGFDEAREGEVPTIFIVNTCTVTKEADKESRYLIRRCRRENPEAKIVVTGCYTERDSESVRNLPGVMRIVRNREKSDLADVLSEACGRQLNDVRPSVRSKAAFSPLEISAFCGRTRALIKVQDGCNHACSFCKVVLVRGKSRSRSLREIVEEAKRLRDHGFSEIVLTGVQLGAYGLDLEKKQALAGLLEQVSLIEGLKRIRLSSIEPMDVTEDVIDAMAGLKKVCPHLHVPLQSGSDAILKAMHRRYTRAQYLGLIEKLKARLQSFVLTTDVMVGFPFETDQDFDATMEVLREVRPYKCHVFPYSPREGTKAFGWPAVSRNKIAERLKELSVSEAEWRREIHTGYLGGEIEVLVEDVSSRSAPEGRARNYVPIRFEPPHGVKAGELVWAHISGFEARGLVGRFCTEKAFGQGGN